MPSNAPKAAEAASDVTRAMNNRRLYLNMRIEELRAELARLVEERKNLPAPKAK